MLEYFKEAMELEEDYLLEMANIRGKHVKNPGMLDFSFYLSSKGGVNHSIRVKPVFNPEKLKISETGILKLSDDWEFTPGKNDTDVSAKQIREMKQFFRDRIVLFCMVWDEQMQDGILEDYLTGRCSFQEMIEDINFYDDYKDEMDSISSVEELEKFCRKNNLVNFYGN